MKKEMLKELMEHNLELARHLLLKDGKLLPVAFVICKNEMGIVPLSFRDANEKNMQAAIIRKLAKEKDADAVFMITESWYLGTNKVEDLGGSLSEHPMRKECVFLIGECENGRVTMVQIFERENDKIIFGEKIDIDDSAITRFNFGIKDKKYKPGTISLN